MYILYIIFQLKSHAYLYASIPQQIIDEESHPGVLAEFMNSSSDSSSSSSDDSDDTNASWSTARRIKKAMKYRRHRKSSSSSKGTTSRQSFRKKALSEMPPVISGENRGSVSGSITTPPDENGSSAIDFGDDSRYDADDDGTRQGEPRFRDFGQEQNDAQPSKEERKNRKRERKRQKMEEKAASKPAAAHPTTMPTPIPAYQRPSLKPHLSESYITHTDSRTEGEDDNIPKRKSPFHANIPSLLSNTIFSSQTPAAGSQQPPAGNIAGLRRTNSMPVRMNRAPLVGNAVQYARGADAAGSQAVEPPTDQKEPDMSRTAAVVLLLISTGLVAVCAEFLVDAIPMMIESSSVSEAFIGLIILPIVSNAAEHVTAVVVATKNKMDLSIGVSVGSSIQIGELGISVICFSQANKTSNLRYPPGCHYRLVHGQEHDFVLHAFRDYLPVRDCFCGQLLST